MNKAPESWAHQKRALEMSFKLPHLACFFDIGTGKTRTAIDILRYRCAAHERLLKTIIFAPKIVLTNWQNEFKKFSKIHPFDVIVLSGSEKKRCADFYKATLNKESGHMDKAKIFITNYEALSMDNLFSQFMEWGPEVLIADEGHRLRNPDSKRAKACIRLADTAKYKYVLTGTPILNSAMDVFNIFRFLDGGATFGKNFYQFRSVWFEDENAGMPSHVHFPKYRPRPETYSQMSEMIFKKALLAKKSECLDLPPFIKKEVSVDMSTEQKKLYKQMKDEYIAYVDSLEDSGEPKAVVAQLAVTKALRMQQIVTGYAKTEDGEIYKIKDCPRLKVLEELLEDNHESSKIIVWSVFKENYVDIAAVCEKLKIDYVDLTGDTKNKDRDINIERFNNDPKCRVLIANQSAGGIGINLISSDLSIYYSKNFSLEHDLQSEGRNYRGGSEIHQKVTRIDLVATETIDDLINQALSNKQNIATTILSWKDKL